MARCWQPCASQPSDDDRVAGQEHELGPVLTVSLAYNERVREVVEPDDISAVILQHEAGSGQLIDGRRNHVVVERLAVLLDVHT